MKCSDKKKFDTQSEAQKRLKEINVNYRIYNCSECGFWHYTKMTKDEHRFRTDSKYRNVKLREKFIQTESEYWSKKFNVDL